MKTVMLWATYAFAWYLAGFLTICIANLIDGITYKDWMKHRGSLYGIAVLGPIMTILVVGFLIFNIIKLIWKFSHARNFFATCVKITDWMLAGFRIPTPESERTDDQIVTNVSP